MPIYAYACDACGHRFDRLQKLSDPDPEACPHCAEPRVRRQVTAPSFRLAGSGWYETDFKKDGDKKRNLADKGENAGKHGEAKSDAKTEAKPEAKAPVKADKPDKPAKPAAGKHESSPPA